MMKKIKKIFMLALAGLTAFSALSFASCGGDDGKKPDDGTQAEQPSDEDLPTSYVDKSNLAYVTSLEKYK